MGDGPPDDGRIKAEYSTAGTNDWPDSLVQRTGHKEGSSLVVLDTDDLYRTHGRRRAQDVTSLGRGRSGETSVADAG